MENSFNSSNKVTKINLALSKALEEIESKGKLSNFDNVGAVMIAYTYLQCADMTDEERELYRNLLLRYCELDKMAMVMIWEYWGKEIGRW